MEQTVTPTSVPFCYDGSLLQYETLHIRLLQLLPASDFDDAVHCTLSDHSFGPDFPTYEALSYVWGDASDRREIRCNENELKVTSNLYDALRYLRLSDQARLLWIDQICTNQNDDQEKTAQVAQMRNIYTQAGRTIAWLGAGLGSSMVSDSPLAFATLRYLAKGWWRFRSSLQGGENPVIAALKADGNGEFGVPDFLENVEAIYDTRKPTTAETRAIRMLLRNPWFTRVWIIQEVVVSENLIMQEGDEVISFDELIGGIGMLEVIDTDPRQLPHWIKGQDRLQTMASIRKSYWAQTSRLRSLLELLSLCNHFRASDQRDRFYALYGLCSSPTSAFGLTADYTIASDKALTQAVFQICKYENNLNILELVESGQTSELPSWVPATATDATPRPLLQSSLSNARIAGMENIKALLKMTPDMDPSIDKNEDSFIIDWKENILEDSNLASSAPRTTANLPLHIELRNDLYLCVEGQLCDKIEELSPVMLQLAGLELGYGSRSQQSSLAEDLEALANSYETPTYWHLAQFTVAGSVMSSKVGIRLVEEAGDLAAALCEMDMMVMKKKSTQRYSSSEQILAAYRRTAMGGRTPHPDSIMSVEEIAKSFDKWRDSLSYTTAVTRLNKKLPFGGLLKKTGLIAISSFLRASHDPDVKYVQNTIMAPLYGRRVAWTQGGRLALVPARTAVGDKIFYLRGGQVPFLLHPSLNNGPYTVLGPAYVDDLDLSDGDGHGGDSSSRKWESIELE